MTHSTLLPVCNAVSVDRYQTSLSSQNVPVPIEAITCKCTSCLSISFINLE